MNLRPLIRVLVALALATAGSASLVLVATPAAAATVSYAALGDSYSSGVGTASYDLDGNCSRSSKSYGPLWASAHTVSQFAFVACGGATTTDVLNNQLAAVNADTTLITITIGGNDAGFGDVVTTCTVGSDSACQSAVNNAVAYITGQLPAKLDTTYGALREHAPNAQVVVLGYPRLFELNNCFQPVGQFKRQLLNGAADTLADVTSARAAAAGDTYVDVRSTFAGHGICGADAWINGLSWPVGESYHPNGAGYQYGYLAALQGAIG